MLAIGHVPTNTECSSLDLCDWQNSIEEEQMKYTSKTWQVARFLWLAIGLITLGRDKSVMAKFTPPKVDAACGHCQGQICYGGVGDYCDYTGGSCSTSGTCQC